MKALVLLIIFSLLFVAHSYTYAGHTISGDASKQVAAGIKAELYFFLYIVSMPYLLSSTKIPPMHLEMILMKLMKRKEN